MKKIVILFLLFLLTKEAYSQMGGTYYYVPYKVESNGDTVLTIYIDEVNIITKRRFKDKNDERKYWRLVFNLKKVYPYAKYAKEKLFEMNSHFLSLSNEKEKKEYVKKVEKELKAQFEEDLKKLTVTQGRLLIKLIDRETGETTYDLVKELRGNLSAIFWQTLAKLFGSNLKTEYDGAGSDKIIEEILVAIDQGFL